MPKEYAAPTVKRVKREAQHSDHYATGAWPSKDFAFSFSLFALAEKGWGLAWVAVAFFLQALNSKQLFFSHLSCETQTSPALQKHLFRLSKIVIFPRCSYETQRSPALQKKHFSGSMFFSHCSYETQTSLALQKNNFSGLKIVFFCAALMKLREARLCQKTFFRL